MSETIFTIGASGGIGQALAHQYAVQGTMIGLITQRIDVPHEFAQTLPAGI